MKGRKQMLLLLILSFCYAVVSVLIVDITTGYGGGFPIGNCPFNLSPYLPHIINSTNPNKIKGIYE
jgi:hypothetical protein